MSAAPSPLLTPEGAETIDRARKFDACLVALEAFGLAGKSVDQRRVEHAAMFRAYANRLGKLIADTAGPEEDEAVIELLGDRVADTLVILRMLRV